MGDTVIFSVISHTFTEKHDIDTFVNENAMHPAVLKDLLLNFFEGSFFKSYYAGHNKNDANDVKI